MRRNALPVQSTSTRWEWLWFRNPAMPSADWPIGWVLDSEGEVVGYLGNVPAMFWFKGKSVRAAAARSFVVDPEFRRGSLRLAAAFFSQSQADLLLNTSANVSAAAVFELCKSRRVPQPSYDQGLVWILRSHGFLEAYLRKRGCKEWLTIFGAAALAPFTYLESFRPRLMMQHRACAGFSISMLDPDSIDAEFDVLWTAYIEAHPDRLLADRSAAVLRWHFGAESAVEKRPVVIALRRNGSLAGYTIVTRENSERLALKRMRVSDLVAKNDDIEVIDSLLAAAYRFARDDGSHALEIIGFPEHIRERALRSYAHTHQLESWRYWYKATDTHLHADLMVESAWYASPFDGDATL